ncbi:MAG TPA: hypothetical protein VFJ52_11280 [Terriglobia bacterium]|jgi:hypothetical protein|nr:hypothetical protein [Terriglobia bacterium]
MCLAPLLHPPDVLWPVEVVLIATPVQPALLAGRLADPPTLGVVTVALMVRVAIVRTEKLVAMTALTPLQLRLLHPTNASNPAARRKEKTNRPKKIQGRRKKIVQ